MAKFNRPTIHAPVTSPIQTETRPSAITHEGAPGFAREAKGELFLLAVANMVGENTFYEKAGQRDERFETLVREVAIADAGWMLGFLGWLRSEGNMRSASLVGAAEAVKARVDVAKAGLDVGNGARNRQIIDAALQRADEPGELLAYWIGRYGKTIPIAVKRGVADAVVRLYTERSLLKYDSQEHALRFGDVVELTQPAYHRPQVRGTWRYDLYGHAIDRRHGRDKPIPDSLRLLRQRAELMALPVPERRTAVLADGGVQRLADAGMTWEALAGWIESPMDADMWSAVIPSMGVFALARNLRNFDQAGVSDEVAATVAAKFADPELVAKSRMFPFRWLAAYRHAPSLRWGHALDKALTASLANVPALPGRSLILVDLSGSMEDRAGGQNSDMSRADVAKVFGAALAMRTDPTLVWFDTGSGRVEVPKGGSLLKLVESFPSAGGGTGTAQAVQRWYAGHDRVVIVTDEQATYSGYGDVAASVPSHVPVYTWNLAGYRVGHAPSGTGSRHAFGGLSDAAVRLIPILESRLAAAWPWES